jgi:hypothetical protein
MTSPRSCRFVARSAWLTGFSLLLSCASAGPPPHTVQFEEDAGSTHVAVLSVAPWDDYVSSLQPAFSITPDDALQQAAATTKDLEDKFVSSLGVALKLAPPTSSFSSSQTTGSAESTTRTRAAGDVSKVADATGPTTPAASSLGPAASVLTTPTVIEPMLRYSLATALFQEVNLLNRYVKDAAKRKRFDPYVVRMQITLLPRAHREPYDAYTTVAFFHQRSKPFCTVKAGGKDQPVFTGLVGGAPAGPAPLAPQERWEETPIPAVYAPAMRHGGHPASACGPLRDDDAAAAAAWLAGDDLDDAKAAGEDPNRQNRRAQDDLRRWREIFRNMGRRQQDRIWKECLGRVATLREAFPPEKEPDCREAPNQAGEKIEPCPEAKKLKCKLKEFQTNYIQLDQAGKFPTIYPSLPSRSEQRIEPLMACTDLAEAEAELINGDADTPVVVPLMVTDDVESALHSAAEEHIRQLALSVAALVNGFGGSAGVKQVTDQLRTSVGHDYNSLLTISRLADNTYRVRLGAMQQIATDYAMVPRTHNITFLLLVPHLEGGNRQDRGRYGTGGDAIDLISRTSFVDTLTGEQLKRRNVGPDLRSVQETLAFYRNYGRDFSLLTKPEPLMRMLVLLTQNRSTSFFRALDNVSPSPVLLKQAAWMDLASDLEDSRYGFTTFELPDPPRLTLFGPQTALLFDDGKQSAQVTLRGGGHLRGDDLYAVLRFPSDPPAGSPQELRALTLASQKIEIDAAASAATFTFPSVANLLPDRRACLEVFCRHCKAEGGHGACYQTLVLEKKDDPPGPDFDVLIPSRVVLADAAGRGDLAIEVDNHADKPESSPIHFQVAGAEIISPAARTVSTGQVRLTLRNLDPSTALTVTTWKEKPPKAGGKPAKLFVTSTTVLVRLAVPVEVAHER